MRKIVSGTHKRGRSQQISKSITDREFIIDKINMLALSSEHTRSTTFTHRQSKIQSNKFKSNKPSPPKKQANVWDASQVPYSPQYILKNFSHILDPREKEQILEYKAIYYIGHKKEGEFSKNQLSDEQFFRYQIGGHIAYRYEIKERINKGSFGEVLKVYDHKCKEHQALKIVKRAPELIKQTFVEISILTNIKEKDAQDFSGIVRIKDFTIFRDHICILFELLDSNLYELMHANDFKGLNEEFIRVFAIQILNSLNFLLRMKIIHCDIKPQNIVLKVWGKSGIKLIDFGTSCFEDQQLYSYIQSRYYRAPEIIFRKNYSGAIDMWSFGCLIGELCLGKPLFPGNSDLQQLIYMIAILGFPPEGFFLNKLELDIIREKRYCEWDEHGHIKKDCLMRFKEDTRNQLDQQCLLPLEKRFTSEQFLFLHFLRQILKWDPKQRITPVQALQHPWIMNGLPHEIKELYSIYQTLENIQKKGRKKSKSKSKSKSKEKSKSKGKKNKTFQSFNCYIESSTTQTMPYASIKSKKKKSKVFLDEKSKSRQQSKSLQKGKVLYKQYLTRTKNTIKKK